MKRILNSSSILILKKPDYAYSSSEASHRSMSHPPGPSVLPSSALGQLGGEEPGSTRQRRRRPQGTRRQNKLRVRRETLPSISETRPSMVPQIEQAINLPFVASNSPSYGGRLDESSYGQPHPYLPSSNRSVLRYQMVWSCVTMLIVCL